MTEMWVSDLDGNVTGPRGAGRRVAGDKSVAEMSFPVICQCGVAYDLGAVEVTARYSDCSVWRTPCCKIVTDDRPEGWGGRRTYREISKDGTRKR